ncbi:hypothetical protein PINS_up008296 [Pythium insidiosum]|nr:hypothetical protein PINS_up008296 [Pythium insidiosum]
MEFRVGGGGNNQDGAHHMSSATSNSAMANTPSAQETSSSSGASAAKHCSNGSAGYSMLLKSELLGIDPPGGTHGLPSDYYQYMDDYYDPYSPPTARGMLSGAAAFDFSRYLGSSTSSSSSSHRFSGLPRGRVHHGASGSQNILHFKAPRQPMELRPSIPFSSLPCASQRMLAATHAPTRRKIPKTPFKVLDAPSLQDDFYLNLIDWSATNVLAVGLGAVVYLWSACTSKVTKLCDLGPSDSVASVAWSQRVRLSLDCLSVDAAHSSLTLSLSLSLSFSFSRARCCPSAPTAATFSFGIPSRASASALCRTSVRPSTRRPQWASTPNQ